MRKYLVSFVAMVLLVPALGLAADLSSSEVVAKEATPKNLYLAGENPTVDANVKGDLVVAGSIVTVNGNVEQSVLAAGSTLVLNGTVGQNVRVAGGTITIESVIGGDLVVFGGDVTIGTKSVVTGDVLVFGGKVTMKGSVLGSIKAGYTGDMLIAGKVAGDVNLGNVGTLDLDSNANIGGSLSYVSPVEGNISSDAKVGGNVEYSKDTKSQDIGTRVKDMLFWVVLSFITLLVFIQLVPKFAVQVVAESQVNIWSKLGVGFLAMFVTPIVLFLLLITLLGWGIMGYLGLIYVSFLALTGSLSALLAGAVAWKYLRKEDILEISWKTAGVGVVIMLVLKLVPLVGWLAGLLLALVVFGALTVMGVEYIKAQRA